jgi:hypothetical protein
MRRRRWGLATRLADFPFDMVRFICRKCYRRGQVPEGHVIARTAGHEHRRRAGRVPADPAQIRAELHARGNSLRSAARARPFGRAVHGRGAFARLMSWQLPQTATKMSLPGPSGNGGGVCWLQAPAVEHTTIVAVICASLMNLPRMVTIGFASASLIDQLTDERDESGLCGDRNAIRPNGGPNPVNRSAALRTATWEPLSGFSPGVSQKAPGFVRT